MQLAVHRMEVLLRWKRCSLLCLVDGLLFSTLLSLPTTLPFRTLPFSLDCAHGCLLLLCVQLNLLSKLPRTNPHYLQDTSTSLVQHSSDQSFKPMAIKSSSAARKLEAIATYIFQNCSNIHGRQVVS